MLKQLNDYSQLVKRLKHILTLSENCQVKPSIRNKWNSNIEKLTSDTQIHIMAKEFLKLSNSFKKINTLTVCT